MSCSISNLKSKNKMKIRKKNGKSIIFDSNIKSKVKRIISRCMSKAYIPYGIYIVYS